MIIKLCGYVKEAWGMNFRSKLNGKEPTLDHNVTSLIPFSAINSQYY